jgi:hypothetical protein
MSTGCAVGLPMGLAVTLIAKLASGLSSVALVLYACMARPSTAPSRCSGALVAVKRAT